MKRFLGAAMLAFLMTIVPGALADSTSATGGTTVTNATGTISQLNYGHGGTVSGFLLGTTTLLEFDGYVSGGVTSLGVAGNAVTYSGTAFTTTSGFTSVRVSSFTNKTTGATYTQPTATSATAYGPVSGTVKQLNYSGDGSIDGFLFVPSGSSTALFVETGAGASSTLKPLLTVGATVSVTGTEAAAPVSACGTTTPALTAVSATSLTIGSQTIVVASGGAPGGQGGQGGPHGPGGQGVR